MAVFAALSEDVTWEKSAVRLESQGTTFLVAVNCPRSVIGSRRTQTFSVPLLEELSEKLQKNSLMTSRHGSQELMLVLKLLI